MPPSNSKPLLTQGKGFAQSVLRPHCVVLCVQTTRGVSPQLPDRARLACKTAAAGAGSLSITRRPGLKS